MVKTKDFRPNGNQNNTFLGYKEDGGFLSRGHEWEIFGGGGKDHIAGDRRKDRLDGGDGNDILEGRGGDDRMDGGSGADRMAGGSGSDTYFVDNIGDIVQEKDFARDIIRKDGRIIGNKGSRDTVISSIDNYTLTNFVERLKLIGNAVTGRGNNLANIITANPDKDSRLIGGGGDDELIGLGKNDHLDGNSGGDKMRGGRGNDTYVVNSVRDQVIELRNQGTDTVRVTLDSSRTAYVLPDNVENMILARNKDAKANGNGLNNLITGNDFRNEINAGSGHDTIHGKGGDDRIKAGSGTDKIFGGTGKDVMFGGTGSDRLFGEEGDDALIGFGGSTADHDSMTGGAGADTFYLGNARTVFYTTGNTFGRIMDFSRAEGDKVAVSGDPGGYQLDKTASVIGSRSALDTRILFNGDVIGVIADTTDISLTADFVTTTERFSI
ncbi:MAG: calcium-binding protein [Cyanobacteria bacterium P01_B01_bin.77]